jgi:hypothetical protein
MPRDERAVDVPLVATLPRTQLDAVLAEAGIPLDVFHDCLLAKGRLQSPPWVWSRDTHV